MRGGNIQEFEKLSKIFSLIPLDGKKPIETNWQQWCETKRPFKSDDFKNNNAGIACGPASGVIVVDVDDQRTFNKIADQKGWQIDPTLLHETGAKKFHFIYGYPQNGKRYGNKARKEWGFDIRGIGGQVVAPGSIHPDTGKPYTVRRDLPIAPVPQWLLDLYVDEKPEEIKSQPSTTWNGDISSLPISLGTKKLIKDGEKKGQRSEAIMSVLNSLVRAKVSDTDIINIFETCPIGEKYREKNQAKQKWLQDQINKVRGQGSSDLTQSVAARVKEYLLDGFDGGVFKISDLRRELGLNDNTYTLARQCVKRMVDQELLQKHGHQLGCYRVVDKKRKAINWQETEAQASNLLLPGNLHKIATIRSGDLIAFAGFKNHNKTGIAIETIRLNLDNFKVHFFITEYKARMKRRLLDFGIDLNHPNFNSYQMDKTDYIPDKIESGPGVLNVIDHIPNLDNFWLVGKYQDEIHRALDGAICIITHQKLKPNDIDAIGKSFWRITPTLAVTLFWEDGKEYQGKMKIVKAKEPGEGQTKVYGLTLDYNLKGGREFKYDLEGWK